MWYIMLINICMLDYICTPEINPIWPQCIIQLMCCEFCLLITFLRNLAAVFIWSDIGLKFSCSVFVRIWYQCNADLTMI